MRTLIVIALLVVLFFALRVLMRAAPGKTAWLIKRFLWAFALLLFLFLLLTGRLHWLFALVAALVPLALRALPYLRYVPLVNSLWKRYASRAAGNGGQSTGQQSSVTSYYIEMTLDHSSGAMDGSVLRGRFSGAGLQTLRIEQLLLLLEEIQDDNDSVALLQTYLDNAHVGWRDQTQASDATHPQSSTAMSQAEAFQILGLSEEAGRSEIIAAHKRLMQKIHPDRGGSSYLAAKINQAKDFLLQKIPR